MKPVAIMTLVLLTGLVACRSDQILRTPDPEAEPSPELSGVNSDAPPLTDCDSPIGSPNGAWLNDGRKVRVTVDASAAEDCGDSNPQDDGTP